MASIVDEIRSNREKGAKLLENEYKAGLMALARRFCSDESDAEDLVNRTFAIVVEKIDSYLEQSAFFGWMSRILINCHSKDVRRKSNEMEFCDADLPEVAPDGEACDRVFREVDASILREAIERLPHDMKQTLMMHYFMEMPVSEVAKVLSVPSGTIKWRLHYARKILAAKIGANLKKPVVALVAAGLLLLGAAAAVIATVRSGTDDDELAHGDTASETMEATWMIPPAEAALVAAQPPLTSPSQPLNPSTSQGELPMSKRVSVIDAFRKLMGVCAATLAANAVQLDAADNNDAYIESYGTGSICLGHCAGPNTKIEVDLEMNEVALNVSVFGSTGVDSTTTTTPMFRMYIGNTGDGRPRYSWEYTASDGSRTARNVDVASPGERRTIAFDAVTHTYTSVAYGSETGSSWSFEGKTCLNTTSARPLAVFGACDSSFAASTNHFTVRNYPVKMKCYGVKIYESGTLVKNFVPCVKGGIAGLKETINDRFVTGADVEALGYGGDILVEKDDPYVSTIVNTNSIYASNARIAGTSIYFLTGYYMKKNSRLEFDYALLTPHWSPDKLHGAFLNLITAGSGSQKMYISTYGSNATRGDYYCNVGSYADAERIYAKTEHDIRRTVTVVSNGYDFVTAGYTNISKRSSTSGMSSDFTSYQVKLACSQSNDTGFMPMKIYGLKVYESDALIKDFRPFVTNGVPGLIDVLNPSDQRFATTYTDSTVKTNRMAEAGGDLERDGCTASDEREAYLEFPGYGSGIDTGYKVPHNAVVEADFALWSAKSNDSQSFISQGASPYITLSWTAGAYWWKFADTAGGTDGFIPAVSNERLQYRLDSNAITIKRGEATLVARTKNWTSTATSGNATLKIGGNNAAMRLYRFKVLEGGEPVRDYVPCVKNSEAGLYELHTKEFFPLTGGKVCGKGYRGQEDEFEVAPQPAKLTRSGTGSTATLTCLAVGAQSYEWYEDDILIEGETGDSLALTWERRKAKADKHTHIYSVVPVYTVFNEMERGEAATTQVEFTPLGTSITIR